MMKAGSNTLPGARFPFFARLRDTRGFMLAEQLVSIIFIGLLCIVVAAGLQAAMSAYASITTKTAADTLLSQAVERVSDELAYSLSVEEDGSFPAFVSSTVNETVQFYSPENGEFNDIRFATNSGRQETLIAAQGDLVPVLDRLTYSSSTNTWDFSIAIKSGDVVVTEASMTVKRIGT